MIVAGIGCRRNAPATDIVAAVKAALAQAGIALDAVAVLTTLDDKAGEPGLREAAQSLAKPLVPVARDAAAAQSSRALTCSAASLAAKGVPSVAETVALAAAGPGAHLLAARIAHGAATCALARGGAA